MDTHTGLLWAILAADNGGGGRREAGRKSSDYSSESELSGDLRPSGFPRTDVSIGSCDAVKPREIQEAVVSGATIESDAGIAKIHPGYRETERVFEGPGLGEAFGRRWVSGTFLLPNSSTNCSLLTCGSNQLPNWMVTRSHLCWRSLQPKPDLDS